MIRYVCGHGSHASDATHSLLIAAASPHQLHSHYRTLAVTLTWVQARTSSQPRDDPIETHTAVLTTHAKERLRAKGGTTIAAIATTTTTAAAAAAAISIPSDIIDAAHPDVQESGCLQTTARVHTQ